MIPCYAHCLPTICHHNLPLSDRTAAGHNDIRFNKGTLSSYLCTAITRSNKYSRHFSCINITNTCLSSMKVFPFHPQCYSQRPLLHIQHHHWFLIGSIVSVDR